jgi:hypothetical protein
MTDDEILELKMSSDIGETTIREWLRELLLTLWREGEGFSGKRPFGNSGWELDAYATLIKSGVVKGELGEFGYVEKVDRADAESIIDRLIIRMCERRPVRYVEFSKEKVAKTVVAPSGNVSVDLSEDDGIVGVEFS